MVSLTKKELKDIKTLRTAKGRRASGRFAAEGVRLLEEARRHKVNPRLLLCAPSALSERGRALVERFRRRVPIAELPARTLSGLSDSVTTQGLLGVFDRPPDATDELQRAGRRTILLCDGISDPGNLGTLLRCALAFRFNPVVLTGRCADPFAPKVVRASAGAVFGVSLARMDQDEVADMAARGKFQLIAADADNRQSTGKPRGLKSHRLILAVGSEADGLSQSIKEAADRRWRLEHESCVDSLNAAVAGAIMMQQVYRQSVGKRIA